MGPFQTRKGLRLDSESARGRTRDSGRFLKIEGRQHQGLSQNKSIIGRNSLVKFKMVLRFGKN